MNIKIERVLWPTEIGYAPLGSLWEDHTTLVVYLCVKVTQKTFMFRAVSFYGLQIRWVSPTDIVLLYKRLVSVTLTDSNGPYGPEKEPKRTYSNLPCPNCNNYRLYANDGFIKCASCGFVEPAEEEE